MNVRYRTLAAGQIRPRAFRACSILCLLLGAGMPLRAQGVPPQLESVTPNNVPVGWTGTIVATGMFAPGNVLILAGSVLPTTFVNVTKLSATVPCCYTTVPYTYSLAVATSPGSSTQSFPLALTVGSPPVISSLTPDFATIGGPSVTVTINGSSFESGALAYALDYGANGGPVNTTFVSSTQLQAVIPASFFANFQPGEVGGIVVHNPDRGFSVEAPFVYTVPPAQITGISPASIGEGGPGFTLTVTGSNFYNDAFSVVTWSAQRLTTTYVSPTQLTATVSAALISSPGDYPIAVENYTAGSSASVPFLVSPPAITGVSPNSAAAGSPTFSLTVTGSFFNSASVVWWNNTALTTSFVNANQLTASVPATLLTAPGGVSVAVVGAGSSRINNIAFSILPPTISSISPTSATTGMAGEPLTVSGANFVPGSLIYWNGTALTTTVVSGVSLTATVPASLLAIPGAVTVTVVNPGGAKSNGLSFAVNGSAVTAVNPASAAAGTSNLTLTVSGSSFSTNSSILWNGNPLPTAFVSASQLTATVPASLTSAPGSNSITVSSPGGPSSNALIFTLTAVAPLLSDLSPQSVIAGTAAVTLTVSGSGFYPGAGVLWNGQPLPTTWVSPSQLSAAVAASLISQPASITLAVSTSAGVSNLLSFSITPAGPIITAAGIVDSASGAPQIAPGSLVSLFGANMAATTAAAAATPLPLQLAGASVAVNGNPVPLLYASPTQINFQLPYATPAGSASLTVSSGTGGGSPVSFAVAANAPGVFAVLPSNHAVAVNYADGNLNSAQDPVQPGNYLTVYLTGLGAVDNPVATGAVAPDSPLSNALASVSVTIGGQSANVAFAGLTPGLVGVFQINLLVPTVSPGEEPLVVTANGVTANATVVSIGGAN